MHVTNASPTPDSPPAARAPSKEFRKLTTTRGCYVIEWQPGSLKALLAAEGLSAEEIRVQDSRELHGLIRDLLLLALRDEMESCRRSPITRLARGLMRRKRRAPRGPGWKLCPAA